MGNASIGDLADQLVSMATTISKDVLLMGSTPPLPPQPSDLSILVAGAIAGISVDTSLYPVDTIKSRLQSKEGFFKSGGFKHLYRGLSPVLAGSIPNSALFFIVYESIKNRLHQYKPLSPNENGHAFGHIIAASLAEVAACSIRVPCEVIKMRSQTMSDPKQSRGLKLTAQVLAREGPAGLYRGFSSTVMRDLPFSAIQYPLWERLKHMHLKRHQQPVTATQSALYGSAAGAVAAFVTTPLDVAKSRIMLAEPGEALASGRVMEALSAVRAERGIGGLFAGVAPRVLWISVGAFIFLGAYEKTLELFSP